MYNWNMVGETNSNFVERGGGVFVCEAAVCNINTP